MPNAFVNFDRKKLEELKAARTAGLLDGTPTFVFEGNIWFVQYAAYVIEYLEARLPKE